MCTSDSIVIIPTYNEKENIEKIIRAVFALEKCFHILVIDDGSPDGTAAIVRSMIATEFSEQQVAVLRWFFGLQPADRQRWEYIQGSVENFVDFRQKMEAEIANKYQNQ
jgi:glycosyltransferase involved in cell wall biosynthesis